LKEKLGQSGHQYEKCFNPVQEEDEQKQEQEAAQLVARLKQDREQVSIIE
jgi:hypothetical protein